MPISSLGPGEPGLREPGLRELGASIHPTRLAQHLDASLSAATIGRLQRSPRLQARLAALLLDDDLDAHESVWERDLLLGQDPRRAALLAGSIWHARSLLKLISKHDLAVLIERVGAEVQSFGIRHTAHAVATTTIDDPEQLVQQIEHDGHACLGAWLDHAPVLGRSRVLLRLPAGTAAESPAPAHCAAADELLAIVLARFETEGSPA